MHSNRRSGAGERDDSTVVRAEGKGRMTSVPTSLVSPLAWLAVLGVGMQLMSCSAQVSTPKPIASLQAFSAATVRVGSHLRRPREPSAVDKYPARVRRSVLLPNSHQSSHTGTEKDRDDK